MPEAARTLVKSPPELWAEVSDPEALARHLGAFGEIRITRLEPEATVAWEGDRARGTVDLEPAGWGTRVTVTAEELDPPPAAEQDEPEEADEPAASEPVAVAETAAGELAEAEPAPETPPAPAPEPEALAPEPPDAPADVVPPRRRRGLFARLFGRRGAAVAEAPADETATVAVAEVEPASAEVVVEAVEPEPQAHEPEPEPAPDPEPEPAPEPAADARVEASVVLGEMLDRLGTAHHRPFSRG